LRQAPLTPTLSPQERGEGEEVVPSRLDLAPMAPTLERLEP
jgi:hypothetical protein